MTMTQTPAWRATEAVGRAVAVAAGDAQRTLWYVDRLRGPGSTFNLSLAWRLAGRLDEAALADAVRALVQRHAALRSAFREEQGEPELVIAATADDPLDWVDAPALADSPGELATTLAARAARPFDLGRAPLARIDVLRLGPADHVLQLVIHHIVADGWSLGLLARDLSTGYAQALGVAEAGTDPAACRPGSTGSTGYPDFLAWQRE